MTGTTTLLAGPGLSPVVFAAERSIRANKADTGQMLVWLLVAAAVIGVVCVVLAVANHLARRWRYNSHPALFYKLCKIHGLDPGKRRLLKRGERFHRLAQPGRVFVEPQWLDPTNLGASFREQAAELVAIRKGVFSVNPAAGHA